MSVVGFKDVYDVRVYHSANLGGWVRETVRTTFRLRATKGYIKDGPLIVTMLMSRDDHRPMNWQSERVEKFRRVATYLGRRHQGFAAKPASAPKIQAQTGKMATGAPRARSSGRGT